MRNLTILLCFCAMAIFRVSAQPYDDSLSVDRHLIKISQVEYLNGILAETNRTRHDSTDPLAVRGLILDSDCDEICQNFLVDRKSKKKKMLPSSFDQGIIKLLFDPSNNRFALYSSYDGPDYVNHYFHRAEIFVFDAPPAPGLAAISEQFQFHLYQWSIEDMVWLDHKTLALKLHKGTASKNGGYAYFKLKL